MPLLIAARQIPNPSASRYVKSGPYLLANSHPISLALVSLHAHHLITRWIALTRPRNPNRSKKSKETRASQRLSVGQQPTVFQPTGSKLPATSVRRTQLQNSRNFSTGNPERQSWLPRVAPPRVTTASPSPSMRVYVPLSMASLPDMVSLLRSKFVEWSVMSSSTSWMQFISWCFVSLCRTPRPQPRLALYTMERVLCIWRRC